MITPVFARPILSVAVIGMVLCCAGAPRGFAVPAKASPPNVLFIMTDDHAAHAVGAYGGRLATLNPTPTLDRLANEGMVFRNAFATNSICTPSRASILTGQYSQTNNVLDLGGNLPGERQFLAQAMSSAGYHTAVIGKWHLKAEPSAFDYYKVLPSQGKYFDPDFRIQGEKNWPENVVRYTGHSSDVIADQTIAWLKSRRDSRPFFLMSHFKAPHDMFEYAPRYESYLANTHIPEPTDLYEPNTAFGSVATRGVRDKLRHEIGTSVSKRNRRRNMGQHMHVDPRLPDRHYTREAYQRYLKAYLRCVKGVDDNLARIFAALKSLGLYDNTIIIYTSDQGMMLGEHDYIDKRWAYDESMRMPFIVRNPLVNRPTRESDILINNTDFSPFILDMVGATIPSQMQGRSFASALNGKTPHDWRTATYYRYWMHRAHHDVPAHFGLRTKRHKLIFFYGSHYEEQVPPYYDDQFIAQGRKSPIAEKTPPAWELYDLQKDPSEQHNLYGDPRYAEVARNLKLELKRQRARYGETDANYPHLQSIIDRHWND